MILASTLFDQQEPNKHTALAEYAGSLPLGIDDEAGGTASAGACSWSTDVAW